MSGFRFEKLDVWHKAIELADKIYLATEEFPTDERFGLTNQMRRASVSVSSNIAEGSSRSSNKEYARFVEIAYGSVMEIVSQLHLAQRRRFISEEPFKTIYQLCDDVARMLSGLRASLIRE